MPEGAENAYQPSAEELVTAIKEIKLKNPDYGIKRVYTELKVATVICASCMKTYPYCESCMHALSKENMCQLRQSRVCNELCHCQYCADREGGWQRI